MRLSIILILLLSCNIGLAAETTNTWVRNSGCTGDITPSFAQLNRYSATGESFSMTTSWAKYDGFDTSPFNLSTGGETITTSTTDDRLQVGNIGLGVYEISYTLAIDVPNGVEVYAAAALNGVVIPESEIIAKAGVQGSVNLAGVGLAPLSTDDNYIELFIKSDGSNTATVFAITFKAVRVGCLEYEQE